VDDWAAQASGDTAGVCALPGCGVRLEHTPGRPQRRYCGAAHRMAMRRLRRAQAHTAEDPVAAATLPWLREPVEAHAEEPAADEPATVELPAPPAPRSGWTRAIARHKRIVAVLGATAILLGGYALTSATAPQDPPGPTVAAPSSEEQWASRAELALSAVSSQLDALGVAEQDWRHTAAADATPPAAVRRMEQRRQVLEQQRATLQSQLESYRELARSTDELRKADEQLAAIDELLAADTGRDQAWSTALAAQRDLRARHRDGVQAQVATLRDGVDAAVRTPLPDEQAEAVRTRKVAEDVKALGSGAPAPAAPTLPTRPPLAQGREEERNPGAPVGTSGPPDPRGPQDEKAEKERAAARRAKTPGGRGAGAGDAVEGAGRGAGEAARSAGRGAGGAVEGVGRGAGDAVEGVGRGEGEAVDGVGRGAGDAVGGVGRGAGNAVEGVGRGAGEAVSGVGRGVGSAAQGVGRGAGDAVEGVGRGAGDAVGAVSRGAGNAVEGVGRGAGEALSGVGRGAGDAVQGTGRGVGEAVSGVGGGARDAVAGLGQAAGGAVGAVGRVLGAPGTGSPQTSAEGTSRERGGVSAVRGVGADRTDSISPAVDRSGSVGGAAGEAREMPRAETGPSSGRAGVPSTVTSETKGVASSVAGPMIRSMTPAFVGPIVEAALQGADRRIAEQQPGVAPRHESAPLDSVLAGAGGSTGGSSWSDATRTAGPAVPAPGAAWTASATSTGQVPSSTTVDERDSGGDRRRTDPNGTSSGSPSWTDSGTRGSGPVSGTQPAAGVSSGPAQTDDGSRSRDSAGSSGSTWNNGTPESTGTASTGTGSTGTASTGTGSTGTASTGTGSTGTASTGTASTSGGSTSGGSTSGGSTSGGSTGDRYTDSRSNDSGSGSTGSDRRAADSSGDTDGSQSSGSERSGGASADSGSNERSNGDSGGDSSGSGGGNHDSRSETTRSGSAGWSTGSGGDQGGSGDARPGDSGTSDGGDGGSSDESG
jgi:hypothetical protein